MGQRIEGLCDIATGLDRQAERGEGVVGLEAANEAEPRLVAAPPDGHAQAQTVGLGRKIGDMDVTGLVTEAADPVACGTANLCNGFEIRGIGVQDRRAVMGQQVAKQPQLGREIGLVGLVIVEVVARQVGEGRCREPHAVKAMLVEAMGRCFQRQVVQAGARQISQCLVEGDRIGRGQARAAIEAVGIEAKRAHTGRLVAQMRPDLACEAYHRRLAVGAGHANHGAWLVVVKAGRELGQAQAGILIGDELGVLGGAARQLRAARCQHGNGAACNRVFDEVPPVDAGILGRAG